MLEALRCQLPDFNNGEDNVVYKTLLGTVLACPGKNHCCDPRVYRPAFFPPSEPRKTNCRQQWKARRAEIEVLATRTEQKCNAAKRIPVIADTVLLRTHASAAQPGENRPLAAAPLKVPSDDQERVRVPAWDLNKRRAT